MRILIAIVLLSLTIPFLQAQPVEKDTVTIGESGLEIPRFVSISSDKANLRTGPGEQYPILWVYSKKDYPLEIIAEYESWRKVRDIDGGEGWMHVVLLSGKRTVLVIGAEPQTLYREPDTLSRPVARLEPGVIGEILECDGQWCKVDAGREDGWIMARNLWGIYANEVIE